jgi:hypothetical protein
MQGFRGRNARCLGLVIGVVGLLVGPAPGAQATSTATIVRAASYCAVDGLVGSNAECPLYSQKVTGTAAATARADIVAGTFAVGAAAQPNGKIPHGRNASGILELRSNAVTSAGGPVKVVLSNLSGASTRHCPRVCAALGNTGSSTAVWVQLLVKGSASNIPQAACPITWSGETAPQVFVVPDDCAPNDVSLDAPPNSTFEVVVMLIAQAQANGPAAKAKSALSGQVREIRVS